MNLYKRSIKNEDLNLQMQNYISQIRRLRQCFNNYTDTITELIPALLWESENDCEAAVSFLCKYLSEEDVIRFIGDSKHIYLCLDYMCTGKSVTANCNRIVDYLRIAGGYRGGFVGVVVIDIQDVKHLNADFVRIMQHIKKHTPGCIYFILDHIRKNAAETEYALGKASYRVFSVIDERINADIASECIESMLRDYGLVVSDKGRTGIRSMLEQLIREKRITYTYQVKDLCKDIVFYLYGQGCKGIVSDLQLDSYFSQCRLCKSSSNKKRSIGFIRDEIGEKL